MFRRKNGSLNLSIQAIVILVMAMAVLGLGLGFIRSIFASGGEKLIGEIDNINIMQASDTQTMVATNTVKVSQGGYAQLQVSVYNKDNTAATALTITSPTCVGDTAAAITISCPGSVTVPLKEARNFGCSVSATGAAATKLYTCQVKAGSLSTSYFVEVTV